MRQQILSISIIALLVITLSACHSMPEHAKFIPKNATAVLSVNVSGMGKKIAWNAIIGSKIFDEWKARPQQKDAMKGIDNAGIDYMNTMYVYTQKDERFSGGQRITGLVPLDDASKFETFLKKNFPEVTVKDQGKRKEALVNENMYAAWDKELLVIMNAKASQILNFDESDTGNIAVQPAATLDASALSAEMEKSFAIGKDNALTGNKHFAALQKEGHDISVWVNYEIIMSDYKDAGSMAGLSLSNSLWKDAAFTTGLDFDKGSIKSDMKYYMPEELKEIGREMGATNVDKDMVEKLPTNNLDMIGAWHLSPKGLKSILEKTGVLGLVNVALASQSLTMDEVLTAFTGDMGFTVNDFSVAANAMAVEPHTDSTESAYHASDYKTNANYVYVIKIGKKESFNKLMQLAITSEMVQSLGNNTYAMKNAGAESPVMVLNDKYAVISNKAENAAAYLNGGNKGPKLSGLAASSLTGHPMGMYFDIQQMVKSIDPGVKNLEIDPALVAEGKKLLENMAMSGGEFKNGAFQTTMAVNFMNKEENSLIQILNFAMHVSEAQNKGTTAYNGKMH